MDHLHSLLLIKVCMCEYVCEGEAHNYVRRIIMTQLIAVNCIIILL